MGKNLFTFKLILKKIHIDIELSILFITEGLISFYSVDDFLKRDESN